MKTETSKVLEVDNKFLNYIEKTKIGTVKKLRSF